MSFTDLYKLMLAGYTEGVKKSILCEKGEKGIQLQVLLMKGRYVCTQVFELMSESPVTICYEGHRFVLPVFDTI